MQQTSNFTAPAANLKEISSGLTSLSKYVLALILPSVFYTIFFVSYCLSFTELSTETKLTSLIGILAGAVAVVCIFCWSQSIKFASMDENGVYIANHVWQRRVLLTYSEIDNITYSTYSRPPMIMIHCKPHPVLGKTIRIALDYAGIWNRPLFEELYQNWSLKK